MALTLLHKITFHSHVIGLAVMAIVFAAPGWIHVRSISPNGESFTMDAGLMVKCITTTGDEVYNQNNECSFLLWDDFDGYMPGWVNGARIMIGICLYLMLLTVTTDIVMACCGRCKNKWFLAQGLLCLHAGLITIAAAIMWDQYIFEVFEVMSYEFPLGYNEVHQHWTFYLACVNGGFLTLFGFVTLFAKNSEERCTPLMQKPPSYTVPLQNYGTVQE